MFESPLRVLSESQLEQMKLKFYNSDIHRASFALPQFAKKVCRSVLNRLRVHAASYTLETSQCA